MGKSFWDYVAPVLGTVAGSLIGNPELGLLPSLGTAAGGAIGAGIGSGLSKGIETGNPIAGLTSAVATGGGSYLGSQLLGPSLSGIGAGTNATSGAATQGFMGTPVATSLSDQGLSGAGSVFGSQTPGSLVGGAVGSTVGQAGAQSALPGLFQSPTSTPAGPSPFMPTEAAQAALPASLSSYQNLDPLQQATNIASKGVYGGGEGADETNYFNNLINRQLYGSNGQLATDTSSINPVENSFINQIGLGGYSSPTDLLQKISNYSYS